MSNPPAAFVAGATGLTGRNVVAALRARGLTVYAHVRPDSSRIEHWQQHFGALGAQVDTSAWTPAAMTATLRAHRPAVVFALLGTTRKRMKAEGVDYEKVDLGLTTLLIDACKAAEIPCRFVYLSSQGASPGTRSAYLAARVAAEAHLRASGLAFTIARPSIIQGERDEGRPGEHLGAVVGDGALALVRLFGGRGLADRFGSIDAGVLAEGLVRAGLDPAAAGQVVQGTALR